MKTGAKISQCRKEAGLSQEVLAAKLGISRQAVSRWETGEAMPDTDRIIQLSRLFGVSTDYLLLDEVEEKKPTLPEPVPEEAAPSDSKKKWGICLLITGIALVLLAVFSAGLYSEVMTSWYWDLGKFGSALLRTWRVVFLVLGSATAFAGAWITWDFS